MKGASTINSVVVLLVGAAAGGLGVFIWMQPRHVAEQHPDACCPSEGLGASYAGEKTDHDEHCVELSDEAIQAAGIETAEAGGGEIEETLKLPAEIVLDADRVAHIVPRVPGIVRRVDKFLGDKVEAGEVMAVLESRELAEAKAAFLAAQQRSSLAQAHLKSAESLHAKKIMPDLEFLAVRKEAAGAEIELQTTENKLHALGVPHSQCEKLAEEGDTLAMYELRAPFAGTVVAKHCSLGEVVSDQTDFFVLADLSRVWANVTVYPHDLGRVALGQKVNLRAGELAADGEVAYLSPTVSEKTRTGTARVVVANSDGRWRPGTFATAAIVISRVDVPVVVANEAIQKIENKPVVFVAKEGEFVACPVEVGRSSATHTEIRSGLSAGESYVVKGAFVLKAELGKGTGGHEH
ncbi:MAG TPA: efflux RND transporter periplasmic adaptor subunit [Phycisphaerae bacterium]|nr:efflux RND transporter periplasmic adaptor subunit [Phycisphaerae bacterium]